MISAPDGFSFDTSISTCPFLFLFQTPEAPVTLFLFPDALFWLLGGAVGEPTLNLSTL